MPSLTFEQRIDRLRAEVAQDGQKHSFLLELNEDQALDMASGYVPADVKAMLMTMLDWHEEDKRRAARPVKARKRA